MLFILINSLLLRIFILLFAIGYVQEGGDLNIIDVMRLSEALELSKHF